MHKFVIEPLDTLFFRDGRPFNQGEGYSGIDSLFPPSPLTVVGAIRSAWARSRGWDGKKRWNDSIRTALGGDGEELVNVKFTGPLLELAGEPLFAAPASLVGRIDENGFPCDLALLKPGPSIRCDMGEVRLPVLPSAARDGVDGCKQLTGWWLHRAAFEKILRGKTPAPDELIDHNRLWCLEPRVGNRINPVTGVTEDGMLYATRHVRLKPGVRLTVGVQRGPGEKGDEQFPRTSQAPLGGESRSCWIEKVGGDPDLGIPASSLSVHNGILRYAVHVLTPLSSSSPPEPGKPFEELPGRIVCACMRPPQRWGGWDSVNFEPLPMKAHIPPGTVLFMEAEKSEQQSVRDRHGSNIGRRSSWGFGLIAIGEWN